MIKLYRRLIKAFTKTETIIPLRLMYPLSVEYKNIGVIVISSGVSIFNEDPSNVMILREGDEVFGLSIGDIDPRIFRVERAEYGTSYKWFFVDIGFPNRLEIKDFSWIEE